MIQDAIIYDPAILQESELGMVQWYPDTFYCDTGS